MPAQPPADGHRDAGTAPERDSDVPTPEAKARLRRAARAARAALDPSYRGDAATRIRRRIAELVAGLGDAERVGLYAALPAEVDLDALVGELRSAGRVVALPRVVDDRVMAFRAVDAPPTQAGGRLGVREPAADARLVEALDVLVVPGLAFDRHGGRLGYGAGYYDRWLALHRPPLVVGACPERLLVEEVPREAHDATVDAVVTEDAVYPGADMPTYEYECLTNGHRFDVKQSFSDAPLETCQVCGEPVRKVFSAAGIVFKGSGYYVTDTRKKPASAESKSEGKSASGESSSSPSTSGGSSGSSSSSGSE